MRREPHDGRLWEAQIIANLKIRTPSRQLLAGCVLLAMAGTTAFAQQTTGVTRSPDAITTINGRYIPPSPQEFEGQINRNPAQSKPASLRA